MMKVFISLLLITVLFSCSRKSPRGIIPPDQMQELLWEQMEANAYTGEFVVKDSTKNPEKENLILQEKIFQKYHTTRADFYKSYNYYLEHSAQLKEMLDSITARQTRLHEKSRIGNFKKRRLHEQGQTER